MLVILTWGSRLEGADESTVQLRHSTTVNVLMIVFNLATLTFSHRAQSEKLSSLPHPPILGAFYNNEKIILFIVNEQAISQ